MVADDEREEGLSDAIDPPMLPASRPSTESADQKARGPDEHESPQDEPEAPLSEQMDMAFEEEQPASEMAGTVQAKVVPQEVDEVVMRAEEKDHVTLDSEVLPSSADSPDRAENEEHANYINASVDQQDVAQSAAPAPTAASSVAGALVDLAAQDDQAAMSRKSLPPDGNKTYAAQPPAVPATSTEGITRATRPPSAGPTLVVPQHRSSVTSVASSSVSDTSSYSKPTIVYGVALVGFHHTLGPTVEYSYPPDIKEDDDIVKNLPFLALPDGAHMREEDYSCFHLYLPRISTTTVYGISCVRQLRAEELLNRTSDVTRSTVQKAVVVLANKPVFGPIRDKLGVITRAFFAQRDFDDTTILEHFYSSLELALKDEEQTGEAAIYMGMSLREFVWKFRLQTLVLFKLLLLQKKVMLWGSQVERLCSFQYSLISLVPFLLLHLEDAASPSLDSRAQLVAKPSSLKTSDRKSLLSYLGLPLNLFGKDAFFQPYLPLQQLDMLRCKSYLVGTTNSIFQSQKDCQIDVLVNIETATIEFLDPKLGSLVNLTAADRKWMDDIVRIIESSWNPADPHRPTGMGFKASDDWLRSKFEEYICSALAAVKFVDFLKKGQMGQVLISSNDPTGLSSFNEAWLAAFRKSQAFETWDAHTDAVIFDLVEPRHPCEGQSHLLEDVGIRLANGLHDLHLDERLGPTQEAISKGIASGSEGVWNMYSSLKNDLAKRQAEYRERKEREQKQKEQLSPEEQTLREMEAMNQQLLSTHVLAGAAEVSGRAANFASSLGSFLGSKLSKPRAPLVSPPIGSSGPPAASPSASIESDRKRSSIDGLASASIENQNQTIEKPNTSSTFFSNFRSPLSPAAEPTAADQTFPPQSFAPSPSPPVASSSGFGSFFKRPAAVGGTSFLASAFGAGKAAPTPFEPHTSPGVSRDFEDSSAVWATPEQTGASLTPQRDDKQPRTSLSMSSDRSDVDTMSDVKL